MARHITIPYCLILLYHTLPYATPVPDPPTRISFKEPFSRTAYPILTTEPGNFKEVVRRSSLFVDKSLFIRAIIQHPSHLYLSCPRYWGKTFNLQMLRTFFEIEIDMNGKQIAREQTFNYRLFEKGEVTHEDGRVQKLHNPLLISKYPRFVEQYLGRYPVVYFDMSHVRPTRYTECAFQINNAIYLCYQQHSFLTRALANTTHMTAFEEIFDGTYPKHTAATSLRTLSEILAIHYGNPVILLIDGFDNFQINLSLLDVDGEDRTDIMKFINLMMGKSIIRNEFLYKAVVMGTIDMTGEFFGLRRNVKPDFLSDELYQYFGFVERNTKAMLELLDFPPEHRRQVREWYGGYRAGVDSIKQLYDPSAVSFHLSDRKFRSYWDDDRLVNEFLQNLLLTKYFRMVATSLVSGTHYSIVAKNLLFHETDFEQIKRVIKNPQNERSGHNSLRYLLLRGHLTVTDTNPFKNNNTVVWLKIPNRDVAKSWRKKLSDHYEIKMSAKPKRYRGLIYRFAANFSDFLRSDDERCLELDDTLYAVMKEFPNYDRLGYKIRGGRGSVVEVIMQYFSLFVEPFARLASQSIVFYNDDRAVIVKTSYDAESGRIPMREAKYVLDDVTLPRKFDTFRFVGVNFFPDRSVHIQAITERSS